MRMANRSQPGLDSIVGSTKAKQAIKRIIRKTVDRPMLATTGQLQRGILLYGPLGTGKTYKVDEQPSTRHTGCDMILDPFR